MKGEVFARLGGGWLVKTGSNQVTPSVRLSPDGATMALSTRVAVDIATGKVTQLGLPDKFRGWNGAVFEDPADLIVVADTKGAHPADQKMFRCGVTAGECKPLLTSKSNEILTAARP